MNFPDRFWVPQVDDLDIVHIGVLIYIDIFLFIALLLNFKLIVNQITNSIQGFFKGSELIVNSVIIQSLKITYLGLSLLILSNIVSRSAVFISIMSCPYETSQCYFLVGEYDFLSAFAQGLVLLGLFNLFQEISRLHQDLTIKIQRHGYSLFIFFVIFFSSFLFNTNNSLSRQVLLLSYIFFFGYFFFLLIKLFNDNLSTSNPLLNFRKNIVRITFIGLLILFVCIFLIYFYNDLTSQGPNSYLDLLMFSQSVTAILTSVIITIIIFLPNDVLRSLGINKERLLLFADFRFDNPLDFNRVTPTNFDQINDTSEKFILSYDKEERLLCENLTKQYSGDVVRFSQLSEEVIQSITLPNVDILYFSAFDSRNTKNMLLHLENRYQLKIRYAPDYVVHKSIQVFSSSKFNYVVLSIFPSLWNVRRKIWMILFSPYLTNVVKIFLQDYHLYLKNLAKQEEIRTMIIKFEKHGDDFKPIPSITPNTPIPDPKFVQFL